LLVLILQRLAQRVEVAVARDDEPDIEVGPVLVEQLHGAGDEHRIRAAFQDPSAHALRDRHRLDAGELESHEQRVVLGRDLLTEDRELYAYRAELRGLLQDGLEDREGRRQWSG